MQKLGFSAVFNYQSRSFVKKVELPESFTDSKPITMYLDKVILPLSVESLEMSTKGKWMLCIKGCCFLGLTYLYPILANV